MDKQWEKLYEEAMSVLNPSKGSVKGRNKFLFAGTGKIIDFCLSLGLLLAYQSA